MSNFSKNNQNMILSEDDDNSIENTSEINTTISNIEPNTAKKRGRKPKPKEAVSEVKVPKKRGRKPLGKIFDYTKVNLEALTNDNECIIAHLPIRISEYDELKDIIQNDENFQNNIQEVSIEKNHSEDISNKMVTKHEEFDTREKCNFCEKNIKTIEYLQNKIDELEGNSIENIMANSKKVYKLDIKLFNENGDNWVEKTNIVCWWCCHNFDHMPIGLPDKYYKERFNLFGNFCSFNCALSYNININDNKLWDRYNLLHFLYKKMYNSDKKISPAPPRELLQMFGGPLSIQEFRGKTEYLGNFSKSFRTIFPPMTTIIPFVEEFLKDNTIISDERLKPIPLNEIKLHRSDLKLKRTKPLPKYKNSLEKVITQF
jgi:hypothetical protein